MFIKLLFPHICISVHMEFQVVLPTGKIFETIIFCSSTSYLLVIDQRFLENMFYQG